MAANASVLFPKVVTGQRQSLFRWGQASPDVLFEIAVLVVKDASGAQAVMEAAAPTPAKYQAVLTYGLVQKHTTAAIGDHSSTMYGALDSLLEVTANELAVRKGKKLAFNDITPSNAARSAGGIVDAGLFQKTPMAKKFKRSKA